VAPERIRTLFGGLYIMVKRLYLRSSMSRQRWTIRMLKPAPVAGASACAPSTRPENLDTPARV